MSAVSTLGDPDSIARTAAAAARDGARVLVIRNTVSQRAGGLRCIAGARRRRRCRAESRRGPGPASQPLRCRGSQAAGRCRGERDRQGGVPICGRPGGHRDPDARAIARYRRRFPHLGPLSGGRPLAANRPTAPACRDGPTATLSGTAMSSAGSRGGVGGRTRRRASRSRARCVGSRRRLRGSRWPGSDTQADFGSRDVDHPGDEPDARRARDPTRKRWIGSRESSGRSGRRTG